MWFGWLGFLGLVIILALAGYAAWLWWQVVATQRRSSASSSARMAPEQAEYVLASIEAIGHELLAQDLNSAEACIRIKILIDHLGLPAAERKSMTLLDDFFEPLSGLATHQQRSQLSAQERSQQDAQRLAAQAQYGDLFKAWVEQMLKLQMPVWRQRLQVAS